MVGTAQRAPLPTLRWSRKPSHLRKRTRGLGSSRCGGGRGAAGRPGTAPNRHSAGSSDVRSADDGGGVAAGSAFACGDDGSADFGTIDGRGTLAGGGVVDVAAGAAGLASSAWPGRAGATTRRAATAKPAKWVFMSITLFIPLDHFGHGTTRQAPTSRNHPRGATSGEKFIWPERCPTAALAERVQPAALAPLRRPAPELR